MRLKRNFLVHPVHPMFVVYPLGFLGTSFIFDLLYLFTNDATWTYVATYLIAAGLVSGLVAAVFGVLGWMAIPSGAPAKSIAFWHGAGNSLVLALFVVSWWMRLLAPGAPLAILVSFLALLAALSTAWLGAELVGRLGDGREASPEPR
jgi:uncharacterized membrane protein